MTRIQRISFPLITSKNSKETKKSFVLLVFFDVSALRAEIRQILAKSSKSCLTTGRETRDARIPDDLVSVSVIVIVREICSIFFDLLDLLPAAMS
jgi:hypothetical protein